MSQYINDHAGKLMDRKVADQMVNIQDYDENADQM